MIVVREISTAKPGQAGKLAKLFKKALATMPGARVLTDYVGPYNTVVMEVELQNLAEFEKTMDDYRAGKPDPNISPEVAAEMAHYTEMYTEGRREIFRVE